MIKNVFAQNAQKIELPFETSNFTLATILSFAVKFFFTIAALAALLYLLLGAFGWITSGGSKENVEKAREKIQAAVIGLILIVAVVAVAVTLEKFIFKEAICFGLSCEIKIPQLITPR